VTVGAEIATDHCTPTYASAAEVRSRTPRHRVRGAATGLLLALLQACSGGDALAPAVPLSGETAPSVVGDIPHIAGLTSDTVEAGHLLTLNGEHLPSVIDATRILVDGVALEIRISSATRIDALLPAEAFDCAPQQARTLTVSVGGAQIFRQALQVRTAQRVALAAGATHLSTTSQTSHCIELVAADSLGASPEGVDTRFVVAVVNTSNDLAQQAHFEVRGIGSGGTGTMATTSPFTSLRQLSGLNGLAATEALADSHDDEQHASRLAMQARLIATTGPARNAWASAAQPHVASRALRAERRVGDTVTMSAVFNSCATASTVKARVVYAGNKALVLEDIAAPRAGRMDGVYRAIGTEFDTLVYPMLAQNVGDPLAMDASMGGDGRVTMLFTRFVNDSAAGTAGYVSACNFYPRRTFAASNEDEVFYARVATANETPDDWRRVMRATIVHEAKHLASFAERLVRGQSFEDTWLEEATARVAEELYARTFPGGGQWRGNTGYAGSLECELLQCDDRPLIMWRHFSQLYTYLRGANGLSPLGPTHRSDNTYYASGWSLVRHVLDRHAQDEAATLKRLVRGDAGRGLAALEAVSGTPSDALMAEWALANSGQATGNTGSWDLRSMWDGLARTFAGAYDATPQQHLRHQLGTSFQDTQRAAAGGVVYLTLDGNAARTTQVLRLAPVSGGVAAPLRLAISRVP